jgi:hypothetical protein
MQQFALLQSTIPSGEERPIIGAVLEKCSYPVILSL